jgi:hypothetical protein
MLIINYERVNIFLTSERRTGNQYRVSSHSGFLRAAPSTSQILSTIRRFGELNDAPNEEMQSFQSDPLLTFHSTEHRSAVAIDKADARKVKYDWTPGLNGQIPANVLQQLRIFLMQRAFNSKQCCCGLMKALLIVLLSD